MLERYKTVYEGGVGELVEKKSRFIATVRPVKTEAEALAFIEQMKKKYWDARHNCFAYTVGRNREYTRMSDDGEPSGTAGKPMLDVLLGRDLYDTAVVVTRYFGGILLGTGGLVRAYTGATINGLDESRVIEKIHGVTLLVRTDYNGYGKISYLAKTNGIAVLSVDYAQDVQLRLLVPCDSEGQTRKAITESTNGRAMIEVEEEVYFAESEGEVLTFPL